MIRDTRPTGLLTSTAGHNSRASRASTCDRRRRRRVPSRDGASLLRIVLTTLCCVTVSRGGAADSRNSRMPRGIEELQKAMTTTQLGCDLERNCDWYWNKTQSFRKVKPDENIGRGFPLTDASYSKRGREKLPRYRAIVKSELNERRDTITTLRVIMMMN